MFKTIYLENKTLFDTIEMSVMSYFYYPSPELFIIFLGVIVYTTYAVYDRYFKKN